MRRVRQAAYGVLAALTIVTAAASPAAAGVYEFDRGHTQILFRWNHAGISEQYGRFGAVDGRLTFDRAAPEASRLEVEIETASLDTGVEALDAHLRGADFFNAEAHPVIRFESTEVRQTGAAGGRVTGELTINGHTRAVSLEVRLNFAGEHPLSGLVPGYAGAQYAAFSATATVLRSDFGIGRYAPLTSDRIDIIIETEMRRVD